MVIQSMPDFFRYLLSDMCIEKSDIVHTSDGFFIVNKSLTDILASKTIYDFPDSSGERLSCCKFFDDWFLYAVPNAEDYTYSLLKLREQEHDTEDGSPADGDTPGVTISFVSFDCPKLIACLADPSDENRIKLNLEINRVVAYKAQHHHNALKRYFANSQSQGAYLVAGIYARHIASFAKDGCLAVPEHYQKILQKSISYKNAQKFSRLPRFIDTLNDASGYTICDHKNIYIKDCAEPTAQEFAAILATHTGNTSVYSFAAEVEYHARFLTPWARFKIPFLGRSIYDSAIRADMTICDTEFEGPAPFYKSDSKIVKRHIFLHKELPVPYIGCVG